MAERNEHFVRYDIYCHYCDYYKEDQEKEPCNTCLTFPTNIDSRVPIKYKGPKPIKPSTNNGNSKRS